MNLKKYIKIILNFKFNFFPLFVSFYIMSLFFFSYIFPLLLGQKPLKNFNSINLYSYFCYFSFNFSNLNYITVHTHMSRFYIIFRIRLDKRSFNSIFFFFKKKTKITINISFKLIFKIKSKTGVST